MKLLLDTNTFLWWTTNNKNLSQSAFESISNRKNEVFLSSASCWEISIKENLGKIKLPEKIDSFIADQLVINNFFPLSINIKHALNISKLPEIHKDPFDRMLVSQSQLEELTLITNDKLIAKYDVNILW